MDRGGGAIKELLQEMEFAAMREFKMRLASV